MSDGHNSEFNNNNKSVQLGDLGALINLGEKTLKKAKKEHNSKFRDAQSKDWKSVWVQCALSIQLYGAIVGDTFKIAANDDTEL